MNMKVISGYIVTGLVSLLIGLVLQRLRDKPRLLYWLPGSFLFQLKTPEIALRTDSLTIQNVGRQTATNIEIVHKARPDHFQFSTPIDFTEGSNPSGEHIIRITSLGPKEHINIQLLSHTNQPVLLNVRSAEGRAQLIQVSLQRVVSKPVRVFAGLLLFLGTGFFLYWVVAAVCFLSRAIGL